MNTHKTLLTLACALLSTTAFAGTADIKASNNQIGVQYISTHVDYTETGNGTLGAAGATLDTESGVRSRLCLVNLGDAGFMAGQRLPAG
jgi:hypothetical protein